MFKRFRQVFYLCTGAGTSVISTKKSNKFSIRPNSNGKHLQADLIFCSHSELFMVKNVSGSSGSFIRSRKGEKIDVDEIKMDA